MDNTFYRLYPAPFHETPLKDTYLNLNLHQLGSVETPFVYANFLSSLDGRIALEDGNGQSFLPRSLTTPDDFRLFLELEAQADCLITHGGYLRALDEGRLGNILQIGTDPRSADLAIWRQKNGLPAQPALIIASASLDFKIPASIKQHKQRCIIATGKRAPADRIAFWEDQGFEVIRAGDTGMVDGGPLVDQLAQRGFRTIYLIAGPKMLETMIRNGRLSRLFQTITHQLMGGEAFHTLSPGAELGALGHLKLVSLYYDPSSPADTGQWFAQFSPQPGNPT